jgi:serine/threonine-protein kinase
MANSPARSIIDVGSVIDKYVIEALIGRGGMGAVFVARHRTLTDKRVAIKVLHAEIHDADIQARFKREAQIATRINHPNIVEVHDFDVTPEGIPFLVLEYLEGETLAQRIAAGPIPLDQVMSIVRQVGSALAAAHREGIVHRDLKPQNIFLVPTEVDGKMVEIAKVLDFGISKWRGSETVKTQESALLGTPQYMAPEQATGQHDSVDQRTDVFALGSIVYEMLCGHPAFTGASIPEVVFKVVYEQPAPITNTIPDKIANAVRQAMAKPAEERFSTVSNFVEALTGTAVTTFRPSLVTGPPSTGFASGSKKISSNEALGDTMGSGDYGAAGSPATPVPVVKGPPVRGSAPTVDSVSHPDVSPVGLAATSAAQPPAKKPTLLILGALACIAASGLIVFLVMRKDEPPKHPKKDKDVVHAPVVTPPDAAVVAVVTPDAAPAKPPPPPVKDPIVPPIKATKDPLKPPRDIAKKPPVETPGTVEPGEDDSVKEQLAKAEVAYESGDYDLTARLSNMAMNSGGPGQRAHGAMLRGLIACEKKDLEGANAMLNQLGRNPKLRRRMLALCHSKNMLEDVR